MTTEDSIIPDEPLRDSPTGVWYAVEAGARSGPWSIEALHDRIGASLVTRESLVWTEGMTAWRPLHEVLAPDGTLVHPIPWPGTTPLPPGIGGDADHPLEVHELTAGPPLAEAAGSTAPQPWRRWFARVLDTWCTSILLGLVLGATGRVPPDGQVLQAFLLLLLQVPLETFYLATIGNTPGKAMLGIRVSELDGRQLSWSRAAYRASQVWMIGMCMGIPIANLVTMSRQHAVLRRDGVTTYDARGRFLVTHHEPGTRRVIALAVMILIIIWLAAMGAAEQARR